MDILASPMLWVGSIDPDSAFQNGFAILLGVALSATCGIRAFLPLFTVSILGLMGKVQLGDSFAWLGSPLASVCLGTAVVLELIGDKFPVVDHALDAVGVVVKPAAATLMTASMITGMDPLLAGVVALITGGVVAEGVHVARAKVRVLSTAFTGGIGNPILSIGEDFAAVFGVIMAWVMPLMVVGVALGFMALIAWRWYSKRREIAAT